MTVYSHVVPYVRSEHYVNNWPLLLCGRAVVLTRPGDVVQLAPQLEGDWDAVLRHYDTVGLPVAREAIWDFAWDAVDPAAERSIFFFGEGHDYGPEVNPQLRRVDPVRFAATDWVNAKNNFIPWAQGFGITTPKTWCFSTPESFTPPADLVYPCIAKPSVSAVGYGIRRCADETELRDAVSAYAGAFQLQEELVDATYTNVLYSVDDDRAVLLAETEQVIRNRAHCGNRHPCSRSIGDALQPLADQLAADGLREHFAFDVAFVEDGRQWLVLECNPRFNGSSYPVVAARRLAVREWVCDSFETDRRSLVDLDLDGLEYDATTGTGVVMISWGTICTGKLSAMLIGPPADQERLRATLLERL